ncbi:hypothetical protein GCM10022234_00690 [Aeromicrobium panaciterrae]|uniref:hypothetical protein n=1 Tax=Aeromicrobium panaciterrae TaxID=363861 RepID=UPI0031DA8B58
MTDQPDGAARIAAERQRQIESEGFDPAHDAQYTKGELARAAGCYARPPELRGAHASLHWPWLPEFWKPTPQDRIHELEKAGALCAAEIDRLLALETGT